MGGHIFVAATGRIWQHVNNIIAKLFFHLSFSVLTLPLTCVPSLVFLFACVWPRDGATSVAVVATCLLFLCFLADRRNRQHY